MCCAHFVHKCVVAVSDASSVEEQIAAVEEQIAAVQKDIVAVEAEIKKAEQQLMAQNPDTTMWTYWRAEKEQLRAEKEQLRAEKEQLRTKEEQLRAEKEQLRAEKAQLRTKEELLKDEQVRARIERLVRAAEGISFEPASAEQLRNECPEPRVIDLRQAEIENHKAAGTECPGDSLLFLDTGTAEDKLYFPRFHEPLLRHLIDILERDATATIELVGWAGTGKTARSVALLLYLVQQGKTVIYFCNAYVVRIEDGKVVATDHYTPISVKGMLDPYAEQYVICDGIPPLFIERRPRLRVICITSKQFIEKDSDGRQWEKQFSLKYVWSPPTTEEDIEIVHSEIYTGIPTEEIEDRVATFGTNLRSVFNPTAVADIHTSKVLVDITPLDAVNAMLGRGVTAGVSQKLIKPVFEWMETTEDGEITYSFEARPRAEFVSARARHDFFREDKKHRFAASNKLLETSDAQFQSLRGYVFEDRFRDLLSSGENRINVRSIGSCTGAVAKPVYKPRRVVPKVDETWPRKVVVLYDSMESILKMIDSDGIVTPNPNLYTKFQVVPEPTHVDDVLFWPLSDIEAGFDAFMKEGMIQLTVGKSHALVGRALSGCADLHTQIYRLRLYGDESRAAYQPGDLVEVHHTITDTDQGLEDQKDTHQVWVPAVVETVHEDSDVVASAVLSCVVEKGSNIIDLDGERVELKNTKRDCSRVRPATPLHIVCTQDKQANYGLQKVVGAAKEQDKVKVGDDGKKSRKVLTENTAKGVDQYVTTLPDLYTPHPETT